MWAPLGNLVHQFFGVVTLAYYFRLTRMIHRQKDLFKDYIHKQRKSSLEWTHIFLTIRCRKNIVQGLKTAPKVQDPKTAKNSKFCYNLGKKQWWGPSGIGGWPPISSWIIPPPLGSNGPHCVEFLHEMRKLLWNLVPGEPLFLVKELACFDNLIQLDILLAGVLDLCVHNPISGGLSHAVGV